MDLLFFEAFKVLYYAVFDIFKGFLEIIFKQLILTQIMSVNIFRECRL